MTGAPAYAHARSERPQALTLCCAPHLAVDTRSSRTRPPACPVASSTSSRASLCAPIALTSPAPARTGHSRRAGQMSVGTLQLQFLRHLLACLVKVSARRFHAW